MLFILNSCSNIVFNQAVPTDQPTLKEFPKDIQGIYLDEENDTLKIFATDYTYGELKGNSLIEGELGEEFVLKQFEDFYFLNFKSESDYWEMIAAKKTKEGITLMCLDIDNKKEINNINKHIKKGKAKSLKKDGKYLIQPNTRELIKILNDTSICQESKLKKIK